MNSTAVKVSECAEVLPGFALKVRAEHEPEGSWFILMAKDLKDASTISFHDLGTDILRMSIDKKMDRYRLHKGDVVFVSRGSRNESAVIGEIPLNTVASSTLYILRPKRGTNSQYLAWCMNQLTAQGRLDQVRTGAGTPIIQRQNLKDLTIPLPAIEEQQRIANLAELMNQELRVNKDLLENTKQVHRVINNKLLTQQFDDNQLSRR